MASPGGITTDMNYASSLKKIVITLQNLIEKPDLSVVSIRKSYDSFLPDATFIT